MRTGQVIFRVLQKFQRLNENGLSRATAAPGPKVDGPRNEAIRGWKLWSLLPKALLIHMQNLGRGDEPSRDIYLSHGFTTIGEFVLRKGKTGPDGLLKKDGDLEVEGVTIWSMSRPP